MTSRTEPNASVPLLDLAAQDAIIGRRVRAAVEEVARTQSFILGPTVERFERAAAAYLQVRHAIGTSSGSDALVCALLALGISVGDEVITTPFSFFATVESILRVGATPRFVDIHPLDFNLDAERVAAAISPSTRAILAVHLYGHPAKVERLRAIGETHGVALIEDAAQAFGARWQGKAMGTFGALGCFSFHPAKPLGAWGDAGMVVTDDDGLAERCRRLRSHGSLHKHVHDFVGGNFRLDALQAAVLVAKLEMLDEWLAARAAHARAYSKAFARASLVVPPAVAEGAAPSWALYTVRVKGGQRDALARHLSERGIQTAVHYPVPLHGQPALSAGAPCGELGEVEHAAGEVLSLPLYPELSTSMRQRVIDAVREFDQAVRRG